MAQGDYPSYGHVFCNRAGESKQSDIEPGITIELKEAVIEQVTRSP
jgi:hypothetical protein